MNMESAVCLLRLGMNRIRQVRKERGIPVPELASKLGITPKHFYDLETGKRRLNEDILRDLTALLEVSSDYLLGLSDEPIPVRHMEDSPTPSDEDLAPDEYDRRVVAALSRSDGYGEPLTKEEIEDILKYIQWTREKHRMDKERRSDS